NLPRKGGADPETTSKKVWRAHSQRAAKQGITHLNAVSPLDFLAGGGDMGARIRAYPWAGSSLGSPETWPPGLRTALRVMLTTQHPVFIFWGPQLICFYNDAYCRSLGPEKHPGILGM